MKKVCVHDLSYLRVSPFLGCALRMCRAECRDLNYPGRTTANPEQKTVLQCPELAMNKFPGPFQSRTFFLVVCLFFPPTWACVEEYQHKWIFPLCNSISVLCPIVQENMMSLLIIPCHHGFWVLSAKVSWYICISVIFNRTKSQNFVLGCFRYPPLVLRQKRYFDQLLPYCAYD